ncbi:MAG: hypothetical protein LBM63_02775 [Rikenellaceae bacterium]|jgi:hypothetical protein|nr:hypothetical protein [Rikenellaceae bacterium]
MKRYLLILALSVLLLAGLNLRNRTVIATSVDFPIAEQTALCQHDNSHRADIARQASSLFAPPSMRTICSGESHGASTHLQRFATLAFTPQLEPQKLILLAPRNNFFRIFCCGAFDRATDYYIFALRRIVI